MAENMDPVLTDANIRVTAALDHLKKGLSSIRAGRANPSLIEEVPVAVYGTKMKLMEVGTISAPQPSLLTVQVWDLSVVKDVQKAIMEANLGLNPAVDGQFIRLPIPPLTEERREEFIKLANQKGEAARIEIRQIREKERGKWEKGKDSGEFGEDELFRRQKILQDLVDRSISNVDELIKSKEEELKTI